MTPTLLAPAVRRALGLALLFTAGLAQAQFVWVAPNGTRHYSDQPPPPGTPPSRILKAPGLPVMSLQAPSAQAAAAPAAAPALPATGTAPASVPVQPAEKPKGPPTLADREADFRKRQKESKEAELKAQEQARIQAANAEHCAEVRKARQMYDSGIRVAEVGPDGQKRYLTDAERGQRSARAAAMAAECR